MGRIDSFAKPVLIADECVITYPVRITYPV